MIGGRMVDHPVAQQRPVLHQSEHGLPPYMPPALREGRCQAMMKLTRLRERQTGPIAPSRAARARLALYENLASEKREISWAVAPIMARSARISPMIGANLKPWPEHGDATMIWGCDGSRSRMKSPSGETVYRQVLAVMSRPSAPGTWALRAVRIVASSP